MNTLRHVFNGLPQTHWDYYAGIEADTFLQNPFNHNLITNEDFIKRYFLRSGKERVIRDKNFSITDSLTEHALHTNSIFFLGAYIYHNTILKEVLFPRTTNPAGYSVFPFLWFLSCLFHDLGYEYEKKSDSLLDNVHDIDGLKATFKIKHDFRREDLTGTSAILIGSMAKYFTLRRFNDRKIDHGILAGFYLFDKLVKNRQRKFKIDKHLFWGKGLEKQYALAAATIACHNIWVKSNKYIDIYDKFELQSLKDFVPIKISDFPFLYLLGIVDTMDPIKAYQREGHTADEILSHIIVGVADDVITFSKITGSNLNVSVLKTQANSLKDWLDVGIIEDDNGVKLTLR